MIEEYVRNVAAISRRRSMPVFHNRFGTLFNDAVRAPGGREGRYLRWRWSSAGVIAVPVHRGLVGLVPAYRYPIGAVSWEFPRGACNHDETAQDAAARELQEETGLLARTCALLGTLHAETGLIENAVQAFRVDVHDSVPGDSAVETMESVGDVVWTSPEDALGMARRGRVTCALSLAALYLAVGSVGLPDLA